MAEIGAGLNSTFPTTLDTDASVEVNSGGATPTLARAEWANDVADAIVKLETKVGVDSSAVTTTLDYKLKNAASIDPGHLHTTLWASDGSPQCLGAGATGYLYLVSNLISGGTAINIIAGSDNDLADDGTVNLPVMTLGGICFVSCNAEGGVWQITSAGACTKLAGSTNTIATDTDANLCVYDGGTYAIVKNRLGATGAIVILCFYV